MKVILYPAITLDGFIADLNGECYSWISNEDEAVYNDTIVHAGCLLVGRKTYEQYPEDFPKDDAITYVYTNDTALKDSDKVKFLHGSPAGVISQISQHGFSELIVGGGGKVNGSLAEAGLIDEIIISIYNVTIGEGIPLFGPHKPKLELELLKTTNVLGGIVKNHYLVQK